MSLIDWKDEMSVKVAKIDQQHKKLIGMINDLSNAMKVGKGKDVLNKTLNGLISYADTHFSTEEKYFDEYGYPDKAEHKKAHVYYVERIAEFKENFDKGKLTLSLDILDFLSDWWTKHIKETDKKYSAFFIQKGLK